MEDTSKSQGARETGDYVFAVFPSVDFNQTLGFSNQFPQEAWQYHQVHVEGENLTMFV